MKKRFVSCIQCGRHVKEGDGVCPFCAAAGPALLPPRTVPGRLSRAAMLAAGAAGGVIAMIDCGDNTMSQPFYGVACTGSTCLPVDVDAGDASILGADARVLPADAATDGQGGDAGAPDAAEAGAQPSGDAGPNDSGDDRTE